MPDAMLSLRTTPRKALAQEWGLVLASAQLPYRVQRTAQYWEVLVLADDYETAAATLDVYERENATWQRTQPHPLEHGLTTAGLLTGGSLLVFHLVLVMAGTYSAWIQVGKSSAFFILMEGEWWRTVTALTLHTGLPHVLSNTVSAVVFITVLSRLLGPGLSLLLLVLAGSGGNLVNAVVRGAPHSAVGASTAIFSAVGLLAALRGLQLRHAEQASPLLRHRAWVPLAAALALLAMIGAGEDTDILAHLFGLLVGALMMAGIATVLPQFPEETLRPPASPPWWRHFLPQTLCLTTTLVILGVSWRLALTAL